MQAPNCGAALLLKTMLELEHIGIAVKDLKTSIGLFSNLLNTDCYKTEVVESEGVTTAFFRAGGSKVELLEALDPDSPVGRFISRRGEGIHHIAFEVPDIRSEMERLTRGGYQVLGAEPKPGADGKLVCFLHPKSTGGVLVELCQSV
jgi:methylmalonyl-CoA/ethylmalonyl-CoA epimerase